MARVVGNGGYWVNGAGNVTIHNSSYSYVTAGETDDTSDSGTGQWRQGTPTAKKFQGATLRVFEDDTGAYPEALGLQEGTVLTLWFKRGDSALYNGVVGTVCTSVREINEFGKVRGYEFEFEYGTFQRDIVGPA